MNYNYKVIESDETDDEEMAIHVVDTLKRQMNSVPYYGINVLVNQKGKVTALVADDEDKMANAQIKQDKQKISNVALEYYWKLQTEPPQEFNENCMKKMFKNIEGNKFKLLTESRNLNEENVVSGLKKVFANAEGDISYHRVESVGLGYIKNVSEAYRVSLKEAQLLAEEFGYQDDEANAKFVKKEVSAGMEERPAAEEKEEVQIGNSVLQLSNTIKSKLSKHKLGQEGMDIVAAVDHIIVLAQKLVALHQK